MDLRTFQGATIRGLDGGSGRVAMVQHPWVTLSWERQGTVLPEEEHVLRFDRTRLFEVEVLTEHGWVSFARLLSEKPQQVLGDVLALLDEKKADRRPFKRASSIGPGPKHGWSHGSKMRKRDHWKCKCKDYTCKCKGKDGEKKTVKIDREYRSGYNALYKRWHRARLHKAAPGHFVGRNKKDIARKEKRRAKLQRLAKKRIKYKK